MITKTISNISSDFYPWIMGNLAQAFTIESQTHNTITATGSESSWADFSSTLPEGITVVEV